MILLTNDDGIRAPGLAAMHRALAQLGREVRVVAPQEVQSASGHGITLSGKPLMTEAVKVEGAFDGTAVEGRPADCVKLAVQVLLKDQRPELCVSGINSGANVGINVLYSGTVAAAVEAAFLGIPSIAVSLYLAGAEPPEYDWAAVLALRVIGKLQSTLRPHDVVTVNLPALKKGQEPTGVKVCRQCTEPWRDTYEERADPRGRPYYWNTSVFKLGPTQDDTDVAALRDGYVTVTPLRYDLTHHDGMAELAIALRD